MVLARLGRIEEARSLVHEEVALARAWGAPRTLGRALCSAGMFVRGDEGIALLRDAVDVLWTSEAMLVRAEAPPSSARPYAARTTDRRRANCCPRGSNSPNAAGPPD